MLQLKSNSSEDYSKLQERKEKELNDLIAAHKQLEILMKELYFENLKLRESINQKDNLTELLTKENRFLKDQVQETKALLDEKGKTIDSLLEEIEEQKILMGSNRVESRQSVFAEVENMFPGSPNSPNSPSGFLSPDDPRKEEARMRARDRAKRKTTSEEKVIQNLAELERELAQIETEQRKTAPVKSKISENERSETKEILQAAIDRFCVDKDENPNETDQVKNFFSVVYSLRERLVDSEVKTLSRTMRNISKFEDYIFISNSIIDSVMKDVRRRVLSKNVDHDMKSLIADLILENCKLRKMSNSYMEVINGPTVEKLGNFVHYYGDTLAKGQKKIWQNLPFFNFFSKGDSNKSDKSN